MTEPLITTLEYQTGVQPPELAGYAANVDFWISEVRHRLALIDGYRQRFHLFAEAQARECGKRFGARLRPAPNLTESVLEDLRRRLIRATGKWITHVARHDLLPVELEDDLRAEFNVPYGWR